MTDAQFDDLDRFVAYADKQFELKLLAGCFASDRMNPERVRRAGSFINRRLKRGKAFEENKIHGLLCVSLDANEQFCSDHRCCEECLSREVICKDAQGNEVKKTQYYHKQIYAQLSGPQMSAVLDVEPLRPGEEECAAASQPRFAFGWGTQASETQDAGLEKNRAPAPTANSGPRCGIAGLCTQRLTTAGIAG
jgi:hypothetical protein